MSAWLFIFFACSISVVEFSSVVLLQRYRAIDKGEHVSPCGLLSMLGTLLNEVVEQ